MLEQNVKFAYLHEKKRHVTIAKVVDKENGLLYFSYAVCHPKDVFTKQNGRRIATERLFGGRSWSDSSTKKVMLELDDLTPTNKQIFGWLQHNCFVQSVREMAEKALKKNA